MNEEYNAIHLDRKDNVAVSFKNIKDGEIMISQDKAIKIEAKEGIPYGHKVAIKTIDSGEQILKYGECMGIATEDIPQGSHVHIHNVRGLNEVERKRVLEEAR